MQASAGSAKSLWNGKHLLELYPVGARAPGVHIPMSDQSLDVTWLSSDGLQLKPFFQQHSPQSSVLREDLWCLEVSVPNTPWPILSSEIFHATTHWLRACNSAQRMRRNKYQCYFTDLFHTHRYLHAHKYIFVYFYIKIILVYLTVTFSCELYIQMNL